MWGCFLMSGVKILHFLKDWRKSIPIHQNYTMALKFQKHYGINGSERKDHTTSIVLRTQNWIMEQPIDEGTGEQ